MIPDSSTNILVFIDGSQPTEDDLALARKHGTLRFRNRTEAAGRERCALAVAVDPSWIPEGYPTEAAPEAAPEAPSLNPTAPVKTAGESPKGPLVASEV